MADCLDAQSNEGRMPERPLKTKIEASRTAKLWKKILIRSSFLLLSTLLLLFFLVTDSHPETDTRPAPTPEQAAAAHDAVIRLRDSARGGSGSTAVLLTPAHLDGISALATHGFHPDRLDVFIFDSVLHVNASHKLPLGRWLNVVGEVHEGDKTFPVVQFEIGSLSLSPYFSRVALETARGGARVFGIDLPPLESMVRSLNVRQDGVVVAVSFPKKSGVFNRLMGMQSGLDASLVSALYCQLAAAQAVDPQTDFAVQVRRVFEHQASIGATPQGNDAAFVAVAMVVVGKKVGALAGVDLSLIEDCHMPPGPILLHGRSDLPMHWALSAALAAGPGEQFSEAIGEWKELADGLSKTSEFQRGDPSGFSFVDIAADRSGFRTSKAASTDKLAPAMAARLARASQDEILPTQLLSMREGPSVDFAGEYGDLNDARYAEVIELIDAVLEREGLVGPEI
jgi:hypothetical protein